MLVEYGYFPKRVFVRPEWLAAPRVEAIRSASTCLSEGPTDWINRWTHSLDTWVYSTVAAAINVIPEADRAQYELHAYRMLNAVFDGGERQAFTVPAVDVEPITGNFESIGFDAVSRSIGNQFECSPLSCNSIAAEVETNKHCLLHTLADAERVALMFSIDEPEPGPFHVVEVLRQR